MSSTSSVKFDISSFLRLRDIFISCQICVCRVVCGFLYYPINVVRVCRNILSFRTHK